jgi:hypothetical protein
MQQHAVLPHGEHVQRAVRWISQRRREHVDVAPVALVDEAARIFNLTPVEGEWLMTTFAVVRDRDAGD